MNNPLPSNPNGLILPYHRGLTMTVIDHTADHLLVQFADGSKFCMGRGWFTMDDVIGKKVTDLKLFDE